MGENVKHTPGPWKVNPDAPLEIIMDDEHGVNALIATVELENVEEPQAKADACLIAAAPELLEVLRAIAGYTKIPSCEWRDAFPEFSEAVRQEDEESGRIGIICNLAERAVLKAEARP